MTALALRDDQDYWDDRQLAALEQSGIASNVTKAELAAFLHVCQRTGLDPFARQIYLIGRWDAKAQREVYRPQTGIDGYRIVAQRTCERTKQTLGYEDSRWCGADGVWLDVWLEKDPPAAAKVTVLREGKRFPAIARWSEYVPLNKKGEVTGLWGKRNAGQLEKCAEALALRKAFPNDMAGVYTAEEMEQADNPARVLAAVDPVRDEPAPKLADRSGGTPPDDPFYVRPEPEENAWLAAALKAAPEHASLEACGAVWRKSAEMVHDGSLTKTGATRLQELLRKRMEELKAAAHVAAVAETVAAEVPALDTDDSWMPAIDGLENAADAEALLDDLADQMGRGEVEPGRAARIEAAIVARFPAPSDGEDKKGAQAA